jgi:molybdate transport system substrate-binding protein
MILTRTVAATLVMALSLPAGAGEPLTLFGAASLTDALEEIAGRYRQRSGETIRLSLASSSTLARQIEAGAPAAVFGSASEPWMDYLAERGLIDSGSRVNPIGNRLVLIAPDDSAVDTVVIDRNFDPLPLLGDGGRLALGDPAHVPAGIYARQAFASLGLWTRIEPHLARTDNVRAALALVERGEAPLGIVYATDAAISRRVRVVGTFPDNSHRPITYPFAVIRDAPDGARRLLEFITGEEGLSVFERYGFSRR